MPKSAKDPGSLTFFSGNSPWVARPCQKEKDSSQRVEDLPVSVREAEFCPHWARGKPKVYMSFSKWRQRETDIYLITKL